MNFRRSQKKKVVVGMSGGVDSSVVAALLVDWGYEVTGVTLQTWERAGEVERPWLDRSCCKIGVARYVAERLNIPHQAVDAQQAFRNLVIQNFLQEYALGRTPNPCVLCNERVKFGILLQIALDLGADYLATGHYSSSVYSSEMGRYLLKKGADKLKDQSYFLYRLSQDQLSRVIFPLGDMEKSQVWKIAEDLGLPAEVVAESQEICFVTQGDYRTFLREEMPQLIRGGLIVDREGRNLGRHEGVSFYTVGQRRGLGLSTPERLYVTSLDPDQNRVMVGPEDDLYRQRLIAHNINLIQDGIGKGGEPSRVTAKVRYRSIEAAAMVRMLGHDRLEVVFDEPQRAITPGQSVVLYQGEYVVGGGIIERTI
jgi:tRNA-specific 2-thiouridylase